MNDPLKYETRHLLFEVGDLAKFLRDLLLYFIVVIMNRWKQYEEFWTLCPFFLTTIHCTDFATRCRFANVVFYELKASQATFCVLDMQSSFMTCREGQQNIEQHLRPPEILKKNFSILLIIL